MSVRKLTASLITTLAILGAMSNGYAQEHVPPADPFAFDPDFQWFRPVTNMDLADMKPEKRANTGWFATYDRLALYGSRPELNSGDSAETRLDSGWGHRYEIGYMLPDVEHGWLFTATNNDVSANDTTERERLNRYNEDDFPDYGEKGGVTVPPFGAINPAEDANNIGYYERIYFVSDSLNVMDYNSYELNKTWRMEPYHYGGILEPFVGFRWGRLNDLNQQQQYTSTGDGSIVIIDDAPGNNAALGENYERLFTNATITENEVLAGQFGFRYTKFRDRFTYSADFRVFTGGNLQCAMSQQITETTVYDGAGTGAAVSQVILGKTPTVYTRNEEFVIGFDLRGELAYQLTKSIKVRGGFQVVDYATGIWRGGPSVAGNPLVGGDPNQDYVMVGGTFGIELNR
ncbi:hypothetical protein Q31b_30130 [Novipirellula aureliae]|uniref:Uncharacterized protein n=1 Tax=Novipirellula aureliae TaxID=2527966 RepID=A0A5C6DVZ8_9BACT|nr:hypothetical protein [Novipirellula aureliae]TWU41563.1 hypothetical protein Q31b_30130 [Novipirellula aureliae]